MRYKVGYFTEAMVDYRVHSSSMMSTLARTNLVKMIEDDIAVPWRIKAEAEKRNLLKIVNRCWDTIVNIYALALLRIGNRGYVYRLTVKEFEASLSRFEANPNVRFKIRARVVSAFLLSIPRRSSAKLWRSVWPSLDSAQVKCMRARR